MKSLSGQPDVFLEVAILAVFSVVCLGAGTLEAPLAGALESSDRVKATQFASVLPLMRHLPRCYAIKRTLVLNLSKNGGATKAWNTQSGPKGSPAPLGMSRQ